MISHIAFLRGCIEVSEYRNVAQDIDTVKPLFTEPCGGKGEGPVNRDSRDTVSGGTVN